MNSRIDSMHASASPRLCVDFFSGCEKNGAAPTHFVFVVNIAEQNVSLFKNSSASLRLCVEHYRLTNRFSCSTSRFGIGQTEGSNRTPLGLHRIAEKIGAGTPPGTVFKARQAVGHTSQPEFADAKITTRILWLEGLEAGFNKGFDGDVNVDSRARYIYIHGTADQSSIGRPTSCGCIHLADKDLIPLFDLLPTGTLVWISER